MKKALKIISLFIIIASLTTGCFKRDNLEGVDIYTTVYPIEYLTEILYGNNSQVKTIYPDGINQTEYELSNKQIKEYSKAAIFIYNGLSNEKNIAKDFINTNKKIKIIDVSYGLKYEHGIEELWMSPNNYLMLATTIKNNLEDFINSKYIIEEIEKNYKPLQETVSQMDAEMRTIASSAKDKGTETIITNSNMFKYLENYGYQVISLEDSENENINIIKNNFKNKKYKYILLDSAKTKTDLVNELINDYNAIAVNVDTMANLTTEKRKNNVTYVSLMHEYIENIRTIVLSK